MKIIKNMDLNKNLDSNTFSWYSYFYPIVIAFSIKAIWAFLQFLKWIFKDYSYVRKDNAEFKTILENHSKKLTEIEDSINQIKDKLK